MRPWSAALVLALGAAHLLALDGLGRALTSAPSRLSDTLWILLLLLLWSAAFGLILAAILGERDRRDLAAWYEGEDEDGEDDEDDEDAPPRRWLH